MKKVFYTIAGFFVLGLASCSLAGDLDALRPKTVDPLSYAAISNINSGPKGVYFAGSYATGGTTYAAYWANGKLHKLPYASASGILSSSAADIIAKDNGAALACNVSLPLAVPFVSTHTGKLISEKNQAALWVNDGLNEQALPLDMGSAEYTQATGIGVSDNDLYVVGFYLDNITDTDIPDGDTLTGKPCFWSLDGGLFPVKKDLPLPTGSTDVLVNGIVGVGSHVYILGAYRYNFEIKYCCWEITGSTVTNSSDFYSDTMLSGTSGMTVDAAGRIHAGGGLFMTKALYFVDWTETTISELSTYYSSTFYAIAAEGNKVYMFGSYQKPFPGEGGAFCWSSDGNIVEFPLGAGVYTYRGLEVKDGNIYVIGEYNFNACYWVNGERKSFPRGFSCNAIAVNR